jgi:hypothetical protein
MIYSGDPQHIPMALYNSEAINGFPTGNLSSELLNKISPNHIHFVSFEFIYILFNFIFNLSRHHLMILIMQLKLFDKVIIGVLQLFDVIFPKQLKISRYCYCVLINFRSFFLKRLISFKTDSATLNASSIHLHLDMTSKFKFESIFSLFIILSI